MSVVLTALSYWFVVFFEACKDRSPAGAGVDVFGLSYSISLVALVAGVIVKKTGKYIIPTYVGWVLIIIGAGLLTTLGANSSLAKSVGFQLVIGAGISITYVVSPFPLLASIPVTQTAPAMVLFIFARNFGNIWGVTVSGVILQNELQRKLPASFLASFPCGGEIAFATIPICNTPCVLGQPPYTIIPTLEQPFKDQVRDTFGEALKVVWQAVLGISFVGLLCSLGIRQLQLHTGIDEDWGRRDLPAGEKALPDLEPAHQSTRTTEKNPSDR
ncbi:hypothetical protein BC826DRAFT_1189299 [Russula brevipes]|nr:hypothetical protein BC826DRAFT_1189299 [Russula brevipes]